MNEAEVEEVIVMGTVEQLQIVWRLCTVQSRQSGVRGGTGTHWPLGHCRWSLQQHQQQQQQHRGQHQTGAALLSEGD